MENDQKPVGRLKFNPFMDESERIFYLYMGENFIGRQAEKCSIYLKEDFIQLKHMTICKERLPPAANSNL